jgi:hypothetical protein
VANRILHDHNHEGIDRRGLLECTAWAGTTVIWTVGGGVLSSRRLGRNNQAAKGDLHFVQISDSHIGFHKPANPDVPGERDTSVDDGRAYLERYGKALGARGSGWYGFNHKDIPFVGLNNSAAGNNLGDDQVRWLASDLKGQPASRTVGVFAHIPLWSIYPEWGWGTRDSEQALSLLKRFGSVTVLNGHIHQVMQKAEGSVTFPTEMSTAFPQPAPGAAKNPGPMRVPDEKRKSVLGISDVKRVANQHSPAVADLTLTDTQP